MSYEASRQTTRLFICRVRAQVADLLIQDYPGGHSGPKLWLRVLNGLLDTANAYVDKSEQKSLPPREIIELLQDATRLTRTSYALIEQMAGTGSSDLHYATVSPLQRWFDRYRLGNTTLFRVQLAANYEISSIERTFFDRIRERTTSLNSALDAICWPLKCITVPSAAFGVLPHYAIVAHEIGHALFSKVPWDPSRFSSDESSFWQDITDALGAAAPGVDLVIFLQKVQNSWLTEIAADAFGYLMAGPAFFFALCGFLDAIGGGIGISETHPPNALRRDLIFDRLQQGPNSFAGIFQSRTGRVLSKDINSTLIDAVPPDSELIAELSSRLSTTATISSREKALVMTKLIPLMRKIADQVYDQAESFTRNINPDLIYSQDQLLHDLERHLEPLLHAIPPIEDERSGSTAGCADFSSILNVGWAALLTKLSELKVRSSGSGKPGVNKIEALHSLLLKAVELSETKLAWRSAQ